MKSVEIDPAIEADPVLSGSVARAQELFESKYGRQSTATLSSRWRLLLDERGQPLVRLDISEPDGSAGALFRPEDLDDAQRVMLKLIWVWGDLLQIQSHKLIEEIKTASAAGSVGA